jgi:beta-lactamase superfamily II metal-dependent hydrolase
MTTAGAAGSGQMTSSTTDNIPDRGVVFWPVGTGDSTSVVVDADTVLQIDLRDMAKADEDDTPEVPVVDRLVEVLPARAGVPYLAAFALTHADKDHCLGFKDLLDVVTIGELWATPRLWREFEDADGEELCEDAQAFHTEVLRRVEATKAAVASGNAPKSGDRVLIIGYDENGGTYSYHDLPDEYVTGPGHSITSIDGTDHAGVFEAFIHAPFRDDCAKERNETSLALQLTLTDDSGADGKFLLFGDLAHDTIMKVFDYTQSHQERDKYVAWDVLLAPHHCSKKVMYTRNSNGEDEYHNDVMSRFDAHGREGRTVVSSSTPTPASDTTPGANPPHRKARDRYEEIADTFVCTGEWPNEETPAPVVFTVDTNGVALLDPQESIDLGAESLATTKSLGRLAAVAGAAALVAAELARRRATRTATTATHAADPRGVSAVRRAITTDRGGDRAPVKAAGFGR